MERGEARKAHITKPVVDSADPTAGRYTIWDDELPGFGLRISPSGTKTYVVRYRAGGGRRGTLRQMVIGRHGALTTAQARQKAKKALGEAALGHDPQAQRAADRAEPTMAELCDLYLAEGCGSKKASTIYIDRTRIARHIKPLLGDMKVSAVERVDVEAFMRAVAAGKTRDADAPLVRGGRAAATRAVGLLSGIFAFAVERKMRTGVPTQGVKRYADQKRERFLSPSELARLGDALSTMEEDGRDATPLNIVRLLALTGARKNEIVRLRWAEVDAERGRLQLADSKTGAKIVPLGAAALALINELPCKGLFVFPDPVVKGEPYRRLDHVWTMIRKRAGMPELRVHDLRHSFASVGLASGQALPLIGKLLGHSQVSTTSRYAHLADDPVRAAADRIAGVVDGAMRGKVADVSKLTSRHR